MDDQRIVKLFWERSEKAITETSKKYGRYCHYIAYNILRNDEDAEECVNDTYLNAWNCIPPHKPNRLQTFLGKITRNLSLNKYQQWTAQKRGGGQVSLILDELSECVSKNDGDIIDQIVIKDLLNRFLESQTPENCKLFVRRYWYMSSIKEIATDYGMSENNVTVTLFRIRKELKTYLEKEGISV